MADTSMEIQLTQGKVTIVDGADYAWLNAIMGSLPKPISNKGGRHYG